MPKNDLFFTKYFDLELIFMEVENFPKIFLQITAIKRDNLRKIRKVWVIYEVELMWALEKYGLVVKKCPYPDGAAS